MLILELFIIITVSAIFFSGNNIIGVWLWPLIIIFSIFTLLIIGFTSHSFAVNDNVTIEGNLNPINRSEELYVVKVSPSNEHRDIVFSIYDSGEIIFSKTSYIKSGGSYENFFVTFFPPLFDDGKKYEADTKLDIWNFPEILIISINRFTNQGQKRNDPVEYPVDNLDLSKYCIGYNKYKSKFDLFGICNHTGGMNFGHYFSYCKYKDGNWYEFNDSNVKKISEAKLVTNSAYCLFYKKK
jgi:hypothetical protein